MKKLLCVLLSLLVGVSLLCACSKDKKTAETTSETTGRGGSDVAVAKRPKDTEPEESEDEGFVLEPDEVKVKNICQLATLECYYNNVAKATKSGGSGIAHLGEKDRVFWVEYSAVATLGVDVSKVSIEVYDNTLVVYLPDAQVLEKVSVVPNSYDSNSIIKDLDGKINSNDITASDITKAVNDSLGELTEEVENDSALLGTAKDRAKVLIKDYIEKINEYSDKKYIVVFKDPSEKGTMGN